MIRSPSSSVRFASPSLVRSRTDSWAWSRDHRTRSPTGLDVQESASTNQKERFGLLASRLRGRRHEAVTAAVAWMIWRRDGVDKNIVPPWVTAQEKVRLQATAGSSRAA